jgi:hypothetical protein
MHKCIAVVNSLIADVAVVVVVESVAMRLVYRYSEGAAMPAEIPREVGRHRHLLLTTYNHRMWKYIVCFGCLFCDCVCVLD